MRDCAELVESLRECSRRNAKICMVCGAKASNLCEGTKAKRMFYAADAIEELLAKVPHWISVEERLPEKADCYLCRIDCPNGKWFEVCRCTDNKNFLSFYNGEDATNVVTHWMPLPEPPKEDA